MEIISPGNKLPSWNYKTRLRGLIGVGGFEGLPNVVSGVMLFLAGDVILNLANMRATHAQSVIADLPFEILMRRDFCELSNVMTRPLFLLRDEKLRHRRASAPKHERDLQ